MSRMTAVLMLAIAGASFSPQEPPKKPQPSDPAARQEAFMAGVKAGDISKAYDDLLKGGRIGEKEEMVDKLKDQTRAGVKLYSGVVGWENLGIVRQEKHQAFGIALLCCKDVPVYFYFVWYRSEEGAPWALINIWFSDQSKDYWMLRN